MSFLKTIGKFFGGLFVLLSIALFIASYLGGYAVNNVSILERDLSNQENIKNLLNINEGDFNKLKEYCEQNKNDENCSFLNNNPIINQIESEIANVNYYKNILRITGLILFIAGLLLFVWCSGWLLGARETSLISLVAIAFSYIYYNYAIPSMINKLLPQEINNFIGNWINTILKQTLNFILILGAIFLILTVALYILNNKISRKTNVNKDGS